MIEHLYRAWRLAGKPATRAIEKAREREYPPAPPIPTPTRLGNAFVLNWRDPLIRGVKEGETPYHVSEWDDYPLTPIAVRISRGGREWWGVGWEEDGTYYLREFHPNERRGKRGEWLYTSDDYLSWADTITLEEVDRRRATQSAHDHGEEWGRERVEMLELAACIRAGEATQDQVRWLLDTAASWEYSLHTGRPKYQGWEWFEPESPAFKEGLATNYNGNLAAARRLTSALTALAEENLEI